MNAWLSWCLSHIHAPLWAPEWAQLMHQQAIQNEQAAAPALLAV